MIFTASQLTGAIIQSFQPVTWLMLINKLKHPNYNTTNNYDLIQAKLHITKLKPDLEAFTSMKLCLFFVSQGLPGHLQEDL